MQTITFTCETITPMFLAGADGNTPELRPPSIKGALRFWWRAMNGHLDLKTLKEQESLIFGGTDSGQGRSKVLIRMVDHAKTQSNLKSSESELVPHKPFMKKRAFQTKQQFDILLSLTSEKIFDKDRKEIFNIEKLSALFQLVCILGGFGKRVRRGMGSVNIVKPETKNDLQTIFENLKMVNGNPILFQLDKDVIKTKFNTKEQYPFIEQIQIGYPDRSILRKISDATHKLHQSDMREYEVSLGNTYKGRFASPIFVSVNKDNVPIVTTLKTVPQRDKHLVNPSLQREFIKQII